MKNFIAHENLWFSQQLYVCRFLHTSVIFFQKSAKFWEWVSEKSVRMTLYNIKNDIWKGKETWSCDLIAN